MLSQVVSMAFVTTVVFLVAAGAPFLHDGASSDSKGASLFAADRAAVPSRL